MNILAIDYGKKRIGLACAKEGVEVVLPFGVIDRKKELAFEKKIAEVVKAERIERVVVGLPLDLKGYETENSLAVREFVQIMKELINVPIELVDERFTTAQAARLGDDGVSRDERAAMVILQTYLDQENNSNLRMKCQ